MQKCEEGDSFEIEAVQGAVVVVVHDDVSVVYAQECFCEILLEHASKSSIRIHM